MKPGTRLRRSRGRRLQTNAFEGNRVRGSSRCYEFQSWLRAGGQNADKIKFSLLTTTEMKGDRDARSRFRYSSLRIAFNDGQVLCGPFLVGAVIHSGVIPQILRQEVSVGGLEPNFTVGDDFLSWHYPARGIERP